MSRLLTLSSKNILFLGMVGIPPVLGIVLHKVILFYYSKEIFNEYIYLNTFGAILAIPILLGSDLFLLKKTSESEKLWEANVTLIQWVLLASIVFIGGGLGYLYFYHPAILKFHGVIPVGLFLLFRFLTELSGFSINASKQPLLSSYLTNILRLVLLGGLVMLCSALNQSVIVWLMTSYALVFLVALLMFRKKLAPHVFKFKVIEVLPELSSLGTVNLVNILTSKGLMFFITFLSVNELMELPYLTIGQSFANFTVLGVYALNFYFSSKLAQEISVNNTSGISSTFKRMRLLGLLFSLLGGVFISAVGFWVIEEIYGSDYQNAYYVMLVFIVGEVIHSVFGPVGQLANLSGLHMQTNKAKILSLIVSLIIVFVFYYWIGFYSFPLGMVVGKVIWNISLVKILKTKYESSCFRW